MGNVSRPRIAVYSPALNEAENVSDWLTSAADADEIVLVDTGSTDDTLRIAGDLAWYDDLGGFKVKQACISPWRFDTGYNVALALVSPDIDIAVPLHLDDRLEAGWRKELEKGWAAGGRQFRFTYNWHPELTYRHDRIHARHGYRWRLPAHEYLVGPGPIVETDLVMTHVRPNRERNRSDWRLIELAYQENPELPRAMYYWGRELFYLGRWEEARDMLSRYLRVSQFPLERAEACRHMAAMAWPEQRAGWLRRAEFEAQAL